MCIPVSTSESSFLIPREIFYSVLSHLTPTELLQFKRISSDYKKLIESDPSSEVRIAEYYLIKKPLHAEIPLGDLKYFLKDAELALEINGTSNVFHLTHDLTPIIPWISHLIIKRCEANQLEKLLNLLKHSKRLSTLFLSACEINEACVTNLLDILNNINERVLNVCCCNVQSNTPDALGGIKIIPCDDAHQLDIENLEGGIDGLEEFEQLVSNPQTSTTDVLEAFDSIKNTVRAGVVASIWHSILMNPNENLKPIEFITNQARGYIEQNPHHPAVISAAKANKLKYLS